MLLASTAGPTYYGCAQQTFFVKQTGSSSTKGNHHPSFLRFWNWAEKLSMQPKFVAAQKMLTKQKPDIRKWIARFYYFRHLYSAGSACVLLTIIAWVAHRYGQLYLHCSLIYFWVPSGCFCIVISLSTMGEIIPSAVSASQGRLHYPRRRRWWLHTDWQTALMYSLTTMAASSRSVFSILPALCSTPSCILHPKAQQHHADASACQ